MTEAILLKKGKKLKVFILSFDGEMEIQRFFDEGDFAPSSRGAIRGFRVLLNHICDQGLDNLTSKQADCWPEKKELFCELKKGPHRISFFRYPEGRVLLVTHFMKHRDVE